MREAGCPSDVFVWHPFRARNPAIDTELPRRLALESVGMVALLCCSMNAVKSRRPVHDRTALQRLCALLPISKVHDAHGPGVQVSARRESHAPPTLSLVAVRRSCRLSGRPDARAARPTAQLVEASCGPARVDLRAPTRAASAS